MDRGQRLTKMLVKRTPGEDEILIWMSTLSLIAWKSLEFTSHSLNVKIIQPLRFWYGYLFILV